jgi:hypothetical protein
MTRVKKWLIIIFAAVAIGSIGVGVVAANAGGHNNPGTSVRMSVYRHAVFDTVYSRERNEQIAQALDKFRAQIGQITANMKGTKRMPQDVAEQKQLAQSIQTAIDSLNAQIQAIIDHRGN